MPARKETEKPNGQCDGYKNNNQEIKEYESKESEKYIQCKVLKKGVSYKIRSNVQKNELIDPLPRFFISSIVWCLLQ